MLETVNYPFIVKFLRTFKDDKYCFFLEEYLKGLELGKVVRRIGKVSRFQTGLNLIKFLLGLLTPEQARFYIGCYILAIEYLHTNDIIYRDLKPQNTIVEENVSFTDRAD